MNRMVISASARQWVATTDNFGATSDFGIAAAATANRKSCPNQMEPFFLWAPPVSSVCCVLPVLLTPTPPPVFIRGFRSACSAAAAGLLLLRLLLRHRHVLLRRRLRLRGIRGVEDEGRVR